MDRGIKIPLIVDGAMLLLVAFLAGSTLMRIDTLADDLEDMESDHDTLIEVKKDVEHLEGEVAKLAAQQDVAIRILERVEKNTRGDD